MSADADELAAFAVRLGHVFHDESLLRRALTHPSAVAQGRRGETYQRLEFLGDRVLGLAIAHMLLEAFPKADEGDLSRRYNLLVRKEACAEMAVALDAGAFIRLGEGEAASGGRGKAAILADVAEALIAAVYLDGGWDAAFACVRKHWRERMLKPRQPLRDPKTALQEWAHARGLDAPSYREIGRQGPDHDPEFRIEVSIAGLAAAEGRGGSKRAAEQDAAEVLLQREGAWADEDEARGP